MAVDKVKPLKIESSSTGGTQNDMIPVEANPTQDYIAANGISFQNLDTRLIDLDGSGNIQFTDVTETTPITVHKLRTAINNTFDNSTNGFTATNVQAAIEEAQVHLISGDISASANFSVGTGADTLVTGMTVTPAAGTYIVLFSTDLVCASAGAVTSISIYAGGTQVADSVRKSNTFDGGLTSQTSTRTIIGTQTRVAVNGSQAIEARASASNGTNTIGPRNLIYLRVL